MALVNRARSDAGRIPRRVGLLRLRRLGGVSARLLDERRHRREGGLAFAEADERQAR